MRKNLGDFRHSARAVRQLSDIICLEKGLSIIENPKPSLGHYGTWLGESKEPSFQEKLRRAIDAALEQILLHQPDDRLVRYYRFM